MRNFAICLVSLLEVGCAGFQVPDVPLCRPLRIKTETKVVNELGKVTVNRANPTCVKETGDNTCLYCVNIVSGKEQYVGESAAHLLEVSGGKKKTASMILREGSIMPIESWTELRTSVVNQCKAAGCSAPEISRWKAKAVRLDSISEGFGLP